MQARQQKTLEFHDSGATGGSSTGLGVEYQVDYAVLVALEKMCQLMLEAPIGNPFIHMEPRLEGQVGLTRWDVQISPDEIACEAKSNLRKDDLFAFIANCQRAVEGGNKAAFRLIYGKCSSNAYLNAFEKLLRIRKECGEQESTFERLLKEERCPKSLELLAAFASNRFSVLGRIDIEPLPSCNIHRLIHLQIQTLFQPSSHKNAINELFVQFARGMKSREIFFIRQLVETFKQRNIQFKDLGSLIPKITGALHDAVYLLQASPHRVSSNVLTNVCGADVRELLLTESIAAIGDDQLWTFNSLLRPISHSNDVGIIESALTATLEFVRSNKHASFVGEQVDNIITYSKFLSERTPATATVAFSKIDKFLKMRGKKRDVFDLAQLTIRAARNTLLRTESIVQAEAHALICGVAWCFQRLGFLKKARVAAEESLAIGIRIGWERNSAFCRKCLGRLSRIEGEQECNEKRRSTLLNDSIRTLNLAIQEFDSCSELGPNHPEVGDCRSLLGRSLLLAKKSSEAARQVSLARELLTDHDSKDYMDLLILEGDLACNDFRYSEADRKFREAIELCSENDSEKSEIAARAFLAKGVNRFKWKKDAVESIEDIRSAIRIWHDLDEHYYYALAQWSELEIIGGIPEKALVKLKPHNPLIKVEALRLFRQRTRPGKLTTLSQRAELDDAGWKAIIRDAEKNVEIQIASW